MCLGLWYKLATKCMVAIKQKQWFIVWKVRLVQPNYSSFQQLSSSVHLIKFSPLTPLNTPTLTPRYQVASLATNTNIKWKFQQLLLELGQPTESSWNWQGVRPSTLLLVDYVSLSIGLMLILMFYGKNFKKILELLVQFCSFRMWLVNKQIE